MKHLFPLLAVFFFLLPVSSLYSAEFDDVKPELTLPRLSQPPELEDFLSMAPGSEIARKMVKIEGFIQQQPKDGEPATQRTVVYLGYDDKNLYAVFVGFDREPNKVRARLTRRENVFRDDIVEIMLDTFHDRRRAYVFVCNPLGVQWDALWTEGSGFDGSFDTLWYSHGKRTPQGFVVWMAIPFKSLRFPASEQQDWGVILLREIQRGSSEQVFWPRVSSRIEGRLNQAATLRIGRRIFPGRNVQFIPYGTYRAFRLLDRDHPLGPRFSSDAADPDAGLDAKFVVKENLAVDLTVNPDFSQVESDQPQVTVNQRFEVFFPEKRPFFLENANFFRTPFNLVFTRRIADPRLGVRATGKLGRFAVGALLIDDEAPGKQVDARDPLQGKRAGFGVFRLSRDVGKQSSIGVLFADREFEDSYNRVASIDGRFKLNPNWTTQFQGVWSATRTLAGERLSAPAFSLQFDRSGRQHNAHIHYRGIGRDFQARTGFIPRTDIRDLHMFQRYRFRPEGKVLISWGPNLFLQRIWDQDNLRLDENYNTGVNFNFSGQTEFRVNFRESKERLRPEDFAALDHNMDFASHNLGVAFETGFIDEFRFEGELNFGTGINFVPPEGQQPFLADRVDGEIQLTLLPMTQFRIDNNLIFFKLNDRRTGALILKNQILRSRWSWQFDRKLTLRLIFQYDVTSTNSRFTSAEASKNLNVDFLVTYLVNPWTALYVGVNSNYQNLALLSRDGRSELRRTGNDFLNDGRQFFVKYSYLFRL